MPNRQMAFQWSASKLIEVMTALNNFAKLAGIDDDFLMLEEAMDRCRLSDQWKRDFRTARQVAQILWEAGKVPRQLADVRLVIGWKIPDVSHSVTLEVEYTGGRSKSVSTVAVA